MRLKREKKMQRIGVFICWCGSNIAATLVNAILTLDDAEKLQPGKDL